MSFEGEDLNHTSSALYVLFHPYTVPMRFYLLSENWPEIEGQAGRAHELGTQRSLAKSNSNTPALPMFLRHKNQTIMPQSGPEVVAFWQPDGVQKYLAASPSNFIGLLADGITVLKYPHRKTQETLLYLHEEADRYIRLGPHVSLVAYKGFTEDGLLLEYCERGALDAMIRSHNEMTQDRKTIISQRIVSGLVHLHAQNFIHCDLHCRNVFLTSDMSAKIGDLQGQLYRPDGSIEMETMSQESPKSRHPDAGDDEFSFRTDIFALGTLLYQLWHGELPFPELDEYRNQDLIEAKYREGDYPPDLDYTTFFDVVISKCWSSKYAQASEILEDIEVCLREELMES
jgi:serine/threonine protein kinase